MVEHYLAKVVMRVRFPYLAPGPLEKWLNSYAFHAYTHGFESRTGHQLKNYPNQITELSEVRFFYAFFVL